MLKNPQEELDKLVTQCLELYCLVKCKAPNYTTTYSNTFLEDFLNYVATITMNKHGNVENIPRERDDGQRYTDISFDEFAEALQKASGLDLKNVLDKTEDELYDKLAEDDEEYRLFQRSKRKLN
jgi:hypothetical protein